MKPVVARIVKSVIGEFEAEPAVPVRRASATAPPARQQDGFEVLAELDALALVRRLHALAVEHRAASTVSRS